MISHRARMQHAMPKDVTFKQFCDIKYMSDAMCDIESDPFDVNNIVLLKEISRQIL